jgi:hypothetical protein
MVNGWLSMSIVFADDVRVAGETLAPIAIAQDGDRRAKRHAIVGVVEQSAARRLSPQHREVVAGDNLDEATPRATAVCNRRGLALSCDEAGEHVGVAAHRSVHRSAEIHVVVRERESLQLVGVRNGERSQEEPVDEREHRRAGADADAEREDDGRCERLVHREYSRTVADVLPQALDAAAAAHIVREIANVRRVSESALRVALRFRCAHAALYVLAGAHLDVKTKLVGDVVVHAIGMDERSQPVAQDSEQSHRSPLRRWWPA